MTNERYKRRLLRILPAVVTTAFALSLMGVTPVAYADEASSDAVEEQAVVADVTNTDEQDSSANPVATEAPASQTVADDTPTPVISDVQETPSEPTDAVSTGDEAVQSDDATTDDVLQDDTDSPDEVIPSEDEATEATTAVDDATQEEDLASQSDQAAQVVDDGLYSLAPVSDSSTVVTVKNGWEKNGTAVVAQDSTNATYQQFFIEYDQSEGYYLIHILKSGKNVVVSDSNSIIESDDASAKRFWEIVSAASGTYAFRNRETGLLMTLSDNIFVASSGTTPTKAQRFKLTALDLLKNGIYSISSKEDSTLGITVENNSSDESAKIILSKSAAYQSQKFQVEKVGTGLYRIRTAASGCWLTDQGTASDRTSLVKQIGNSTTAVSEENTWQVCWNGTSWSLRNVKTGRVLAFADPESGKQLRTYKAGDTEAQHFVFTSRWLLANGTYTITSKLNNLALTVNSASLADGGNVMVAANKKVNYQKFTLARSGAYYLVKNLFSGKPIQPNDESTLNGANVVQWSSSSSTAQKWDIRIADGGGFIIVNLNSGYALNVATRDDSNVNQGKVTGADRQIWNIAATTYTGWYRVNNHWRYKSANKAATFENDVNTKGKNLGHYDILRDIWMTIKGKKSNTKYLIATSWDSCYVAIFEGKAGHWVPLFGTNCGNGSKSIVEGHAKETNPNSTWQWSAKWDLYSAIKNTKGNMPTFPSDCLWGKKLGTTWAKSRVRKVNSREQYFTSVKWILGFHTTLTKNPTKNEIGKHVSNGCIRLKVKYAKWIYNNIAPGTRCLQIRTKAY